MVFVCFCARWQHKGVEKNYVPMQCNGANYNTLLDSGSCPQHVPGEAVGANGFTLHLARLVVSSFSHIKGFKAEQVWSGFGGWLEKLGTLCFPCVERKDRLAEGAVPDWCCTGPNVSVKWNDLLSLMMQSY